jgi:hypothetical protein
VLIKIGKDELMIRVVGLKEETRNQCSCQLLMNITEATIFVNGIGVGTNTMPFV